MLSGGLSRVGSAPLGVLALSTLCLFSSFGPSIEARSVDPQEELRKLIGERAPIEASLQELENSVLALEARQIELSQELIDFERDLEAKLRDAMLPLLSWPEGGRFLQTASWLEYQQTELLIQHTRKALLRKPLELIEERKTRIAELSDLRSSMSNQIRELQIRKSLIDFEEEELLLMKRRAETELPQATGRSKSLQ
ncbi:MAG: hypothetical protein EA369_01360 [Bradymonadales bacterium]|nr:MAG: hypothetical protein EA369_01360 [Bradymonadales bacterium]